MNDITEQYLNRLYDDLQKEQTKKINDIKTNSNEMVNNKDNQKQYLLLNNLLITILKYRNLRKQIEQKNNI